MQLDTIIQEPNEVSDTVTSIIWLHGLGGSGESFSEYVPGEFAKLGANFSALRFIFPNAPIQPVSLNQGLPCRSWFDIYSLEHLEREDLDGIQTSQRAVEALIQAECDRGVPCERIFLAGFSQGGALALYTGLRHAKSLGGIIALSTFLPQYQQNPEILSNANKSIPIFMAHGTEDDVLHVQAGELSREVLKKWGYPVTWKTYSMRHVISDSEIRDIGEWLSGKLEAS